MADSRKHPAKIRILVLEEHPLLRHGVNAYLNAQPDMIVCGEVDCIPSARSAIAQCKPDLLLTALWLSPVPSRSAVSSRSGLHWAIALRALGMQSTSPHTIMSGWALR